jgi:hypothetical protein
MQKLGDLAREMFEDLEKNADEHGFLGYSNYVSGSSVTKPVDLQLMYFRSVEQYVFAPLPSSFNPT